LREKKQSTCGKPGKKGSSQKKREKYLFEDYYENIYIKRGGGKNLDQHGGNEKTKGGGGVLRRREALLVGATPKWERGTRMTDGGGRGQVKGMHSI